MKHFIYCLSALRLRDTAQSGFSDNLERTKKLDW